MVLADHPLAHRRHGVMAQADQVEPVGDQHRVRQPVTDGLGVGGGQIDRHVFDPLRQAWGWSASHADHRGRAAFGLGQQAAAAGHVDERVCSRSQTSTQRPVSVSCAQIWLPQRVSSILSTCTASGARPAVWRRGR